MTRSSVIFVEQLFLDVILSWATREDEDEEKQQQGQHRMMITFFVSVKRGSEFVVHFYIGACGLNS